MYKNPLPSQAELLKVLRYDKKTGKLFWRKRSISTFTDGPNVSANSICKNWNNRFANKEAFTTNNQGYLSGRYKNCTYSSHRVIWKMIYGTEPNIIDHIDGDRSNNKIQNLRSVDIADNAKNQRLYAVNTSGTSGITWKKINKKWEARISVNGRRVYLGVFSSKQKAIETRKQAEIKYGFHRNHGRVA